MTANIMNGILSGLQQNSNPHFEVEKVASKDESKGVGAIVKFTGPITNDVYSSMLNSNPLTFHMPNSLASTAFTLGVNSDININGKRSK